uniref:ORF82 n=1 Tax=Malaco herpesvirus 4 TaxID=3031800 RepID=A0AA48P902_9VIRU|nr:TPA_asm: ORF82 [Malaco herpesvirus 4]
MSLNISSVRELQYSSLYGDVYMVKSVGFCNCQSPTSSINIPTLLSSSSYSTAPEFISTKLFIGVDIPIIIDSLPSKAPITSAWRIGNKRLILTSEPFSIRWLLYRAYCNELRIAAPRNIESCMCS